MYAIMGISGRVGGAVAKNLLDAGQQVRAIIRSSAKGIRWQQMGCEVKTAEVDNNQALTAAFESAQGVFVMLPPAFDQAPGLIEGHARANSIRNAVLRARPSKVVVLSTYGAQVQRPNLFNELGYLEEVMADLDLPVTILRSAWYMENHEWDVPTARADGVIHSHLQPLDQAIPMVSTKDVGRMAAQLLMEEWRGSRIIEFEGPASVSPNRLAEAFVRQKVLSMWSDRTPGKPEASAAALLELVDAKNPPLRAFFGDLLEMMQEEYAQRLEEWRQWQPQARAALG